MWKRESVSDIARDVFGFVSQDLDAFQESVESKAWMIASCATGAEQWARISALESHEREVFDKIRRLEHQMVVLKF